MLDLVFLGTGSGIPSKRRNPSSIWLQYGSEAMLFDCGEGTQKQMMIAGVSFMKVGNIFITHWHADHWAGLIGLMQTMNLEKRKEPLYIYGPEAERFVGDILDLDYWGPRFRVIPRDVPADGTDITTAYRSKPTSRGVGYSILTVPVEHSVPTVAYCFKEDDSVNVDIEKAGRYGLRQGPMIGRLKSRGEVTLKGKRITLDDVAEVRPGLKVAYSGDTRPCKALVKLSKDADLLIHDATFAEEMEDRMHSGARDAAAIAREAGVRQLMLTHFSRRYQNVKELVGEAKKVFPDTRAAEDLMRIKVSA